ncbi:hypothetical protein [Thiolapillus sp.]
MRRISAMLLGIILGGQPAIAADDPRPELLRLLDGHWTMTGDVMGKPVLYDLKAGPVLANTFTELHMKDVAPRPEYEARVFIGQDGEGQGIIAHWLDSFGARYSIPHGRGRIVGDSISFIVPYKKTPFRDTFSYDRVKKTWRLVIESRQEDGSWKHFARYLIQPAVKSLP